MNTQHTPEPWKIIDYYQRDIGQSHNLSEISEREVDFKK